MTGSGLRIEPGFVRAVRTALGDARTVLELAAGAGAGAYVPVDRDATRIDVTRHLHRLDGVFDAAVWAFPGVEHDPERLLPEVRRVTSGPIVLLTRDPDRAQDAWLAEYAPEVVAAAARRSPSPARITAALPEDIVTTTPLPIPFTSRGGFTEAYYGRPERLLDPEVRRADPAWAAVDEMTARRSVAALRAALESGDWDARHGRLRVQPSHEGSLVLLVALPRG